MDTLRPSMRLEPAPSASLPEQCFGRHLKRSMDGIKQQHRIWPRCGLFADVLAWCVQFGEAYLCAETQAAEGGAVTLGPTGVWPGLHLGRWIGWLGLRHDSMQWRVQSRVAGGRTSPPCPSKPALRHSYKSAKDASKRNWQLSETVQQLQSVRPKKLQRHKKPKKKRGGGKKGLFGAASGRTELEGA